MSKTFEEMCEKHKIVTTTWEGTHDINYIMVRDFWNAGQESIFEDIKKLEKKHTYQSEPDYELCGFQQPPKYVNYCLVFKELRKKYGVSDEDSID